VPGVLTDVFRTASDLRYAARDFFTEPVGQLTPGGYQHRIEQMRTQLADLPPDQPVRLRKATSNLFRPRSGAGTLDTTGLSGVLSIDPQARTADVLGMTTYEDLVAATLPYGLMPLVVPQLKTITLGGAVTGLGIESTSFRNGLPHESVLEMDILTGDGRILTATRTNEYADLFHGFPNSYGTLGYALRLRIELEQVQPYVHVRHLPFDDLDEAAAALERIALTGEYDIFGAAWTPSLWAPLSAAGTAWNAGIWNGTRWSGSVWSGTRWSSVLWSGTRWSGTRRTRSWRWTGRSPSTRTRTSATPGTWTWSTRARRTRWRPRPRRRT